MLFVFSSRTLPEKIKTSPFAGVPTPDQLALLLQLPFAPPPFQVSVAAETDNEVARNKNTGSIATAIFRQGLEPSFLTGCGMVVKLDVFMTVTFLMNFSYYQASLALGQGKDVLASQELLPAWVDRGCRQAIFKRDSVVDRPAAMV